MSTSSAGMPTPPERDERAPEDEAELAAVFARIAHARHRAKIPFIQQLESADCGAACLTMVLHSFGKELKLNEVRTRLGVGARDGSSAAKIAELADWYGLRARSATIDIEHVKMLPTASILHWNFNHFVVFERMDRKGIRIIDPSLGPRLVPLDEARKAITGIALVFEDTESFVPQKGDANRIGWYFNQLKGVGNILARIITLSVAIRVAALTVPMLTGAIIDRVVPRQDYNLLWIVLAGGGIGITFSNLATLVRTHLGMHLRTVLDTRLTFGFVSYLSRLPIGFFQRRSVGDLMQRVNSNSTLREIVTGTTLSTMMDGVLVIAYAVMVFAASGLLGAVALGFAIGQGVLFFVVRKRTRDLLKMGIEANVRTQSFLMEMLGGMPALKMGASERRAVERWSNLYVNEVNVGLQRSRLQASVDFTLAMFSGLAPLIMNVIGAHLVMSGAMTMGSMIASTAIAMGMLGPIGSLVNTAFQLQQLTNHIERVEDVLQSPPEQAADATARAPALRGHIALRDVFFRYADNVPYAVEEASLEVNPGSTIAVVGASGSGKSTLARIIGTLEKPSAGKILFDDHDISGMDLRSIRSQLGVVFQEPFLFAGSVRDNIALSDPELPLASIMAAAKLACIHDDIMAMPMGYETVLSDRGGSLSGGQRQRLSLARALVRKPAVLILDEATSALDSRTEMLVIKNLAKLQCTRVTFAHRLSTIRHADQIIVMDHGKIVERGKHEELVNSRGVYYRLVQAQMMTAEASKGGIS